MSPDLVGAAALAFIIHMVEPQALESDNISNITTFMDADENK